MKKIFFVVFLCLLAVSVGAKKKSNNIVTTVYMFGLSTNFNDSTVWMTDVQKVDGAQLKKKTYFLVDRSVYSQQLTDFFSANGEPYRTNVVFYDKNLSKLHKLYLKVRARYDSSNPKLPKYDLNILMADKFRFTTVESEETEEQPAVAKEPKKKPSKKRK